MSQKKYTVEVNWVLEGEELKNSFKLQQWSFVEGPIKHIGDAQIYLAFYPAIKNHGIGPPHCLLSVGIDFSLPLSCTYKLHCDELNTHICETQIFNYKDQHKEWPYHLSHTLTPLAKITGDEYWETTTQSLKRDTPTTKLTINATVIIKAVYDKKLNKKPRNQWDRYLNIQQVPQHLNDNASVVSLSKKLSQLQREVTLLKKQNVKQHEQKSHISDRLSTNNAYEEHELRLNSLTTQVDQMMKTMTKMQNTLEHIQLQIQEEQKGDNLNHNVQADIVKQEFENWISTKVKLPQYLDMFVKNGIETLNIVKLITKDELNEIGITKIGHRMQILKEIQLLKQQSESEPHEGTAYV